MQKNTVEKNKRILNKANQAHTSAYGSLYMGICVHTVRAIIYSENVGTHTKKTLKTLH